MNLKIIQSFILKIEIIIIIIIIVVILKIFELCNIQPKKKE